MEIKNLEEDRILEGFPNPWWSFAFHFDEVKNLPEPWKVLAESRDCIHAIRFGESPIWGIQAHPEIKVMDAGALLKASLPLYPESEGLIKKALEQEPRDSLVARRLVANFLDFSP